MSVAVQLHDTGQVYNSQEGLDACSRIMSLCWQQTLARDKGGGRTGSPLSTEHPTCEPHGSQTYAGAPRTADAKSHTKKTGAPPSKSKSLRRLKRQAREVLTPLQEGPTTPKFPAHIS